jgi:death on curing protein
VDGNKRSGLISAIAFMRLNGLPDVPQQPLYEAMIGIAERRIDKAGLAALLRNLAAP